MAAALALLLLGGVMAGAVMPARAASTADFVKTFPRGWCGVYMWRGSTLRQQFSVVFTKLRTLPGGHVEATGNGLIGIPGRRYPIKVRATIEPATLRIELWEIRDVPDTVDFTTDGSHIGRLSADKQHIRAVWTQNKTGLKGDLALNARPVEGPIAKLCSEAIA